MSKHTKGPWQLIDASRGWVITANDGLYDIALVRDIGNEDNQANANVLVAAPDLLEALVYARRFLRPIDHDTEYVDSIIAKARGAS